MSGHQTGLGQQRQRVTEDGSPIQEPGQARQMVIPRRPIQHGTSVTPRFPQVTDFVYEEGHHYAKAGPSSQEQHERDDHQQQQQAFDFGFHNRNRENIDQNYSGT